MIIDDKGMLNIFGWRINIIDFLVLLFVLCLTPAFYFGWKIMTKSQEVQEIKINKTEYKQLKAKADYLDYLFKEHKRLRR